MQSSNVVTKRGQFHVKTWGDEGSLPVVMIHGWPESSHCWIEVAKHIKSHYRIIAPDLRGLGDSERTLDIDAYQKVELAKDVIAVIDALAVDNFYLVGHDWGGVVAQELAFLAPSRVSKLVLMNISIINNPRGSAEALGIHFAQGGIPFWYQYFQMQPNLPEVMIKGNEEAWVSHFLQRSNNISQESISEYARCYSIEHTPATAAAYYRIKAKDQEHWQSFAGVKQTMPALYIHGSRDSVIIPEFLNHIGDCFDDIQVESLDAAHFVQEEKPREVASLLNDFFCSGG